MTPIPDLDALNSATKYPSIETYHELDPANGNLIEGKPVLFEGPVVLTEKVDGTNGRIIVLPDGDWLIGSREELLYARGDRIVNPAQGIVPALLPLAERLATRPRPFSSAHGGIWAFFLEVYGHRISGGARNYTGTGATGYRLFDVAGVSDEVLGWPREQISSWREHGGQSFLPEDTLVSAAAEEGVELTPRLGTIDGGQLPRDLDGMWEFLALYLPGTFAALDDRALGEPEGIVLRTEDRSVIAKAKFRDYDRTLRKRAMQAGGKRK